MLPKRGHFKHDYMQGATNNLSEHNNHKLLSEAQLGARLRKNGRVYSVSAASTPRTSFQTFPLFI